MNKIIIAMILVGCSLAMPQGQSGAPKGNPYVRILSLESYQNAGDFGHSLLQEDGTATGQKIGPDGLLYGFYSYIQEGGNRVKVYYRAGKGVGYEVLKVEGLDPKLLGNLRATISATPLPEVAPRARPAPSIRREPGPVLPPKPVIRQSVVQPVQQPILPVVQPLVPEKPTPAPHRFDYPANLSLQRTGTGFVYSFNAL